MIAAAGNRSGVVGLLLKSGADVNARSEDGRTALTIAQANNSDAVVKILQDAAQTAVNKSTWLSVAPVSENRKIDKGELQ
jgi:ankyrin repeat protein